MTRTDKVVPISELKFEPIPTDATTESAMSNGSMHGGVRYAAAFKSVLTPSHWPGPPCP